MDRGNSLNTRVYLNVFGCIWVLSGCMHVSAALFIGVNICVFWLKCESELKCVYS